MTDTERLAALLAEIGGVLDEDDLAARLIAAGVRVGPFATAYWTKSGVLHIDATGVDTTPRIDPDRLARALHEYADGAQPSIDLYCYHDDTDYEVRDTRPDRACHQVAAAIIRAYEEEG